MQVAAPLHYLHTTCLVRRTLFVYSLTPTPVSQVEPDHIDLRTWLQEIVYIYVIQLVKIFHSEENHQGEKHEVAESRCKFLVPGSGKSFWSDGWLYKVLLCDPSQ